MADLFPITDQRCRSCGAALVWAVTAAGKRAPFDAQTSLEGTHALVDGKAVHRSAAAPGSLFHLSHFATCPQAEAWRRGR